MFYSGETLDKRGTVSALRDQVVSWGKKDSKDVDNEIILVQREPAQIEC